MSETTSVEMTALVKRWVARGVRHLRGANRPVRFALLADAIFGTSREARRDLRWHNERLLGWIADGAFGECWDADGWHYVTLPS